MNVTPMFLLACAEALADPALYDEPVGETGRDVEGAMAEHRCAECGRPIPRRVYPYEEAHPLYCGLGCSGKANGRIGGRAGRGESKNRSTEMRAYYQARREGRLWAD